MQSSNFNSPNVKTNAVTVIKKSTIKFKDLESSLPSLRLSNVFSPKSTNGRSRNNFKHVQLFTEIDKQDFSKELIGGMVKYGDQVAKIKSICFKQKMGEYEISKLRLENN